MNNTFQLGRLIIIILFILSCLNTSFAQKGFNEEEMSSIQVANSLFDDKRFMLALPIYEELLAKHPDETSLKYKIGVCCLYKKDSYERALEYLTFVKEKNKKAADIVFYTGRAYMLNYKFDEAIQEFTQYTASGSSENKKKAKEYIENCRNGKILVASPKTVNIQNAGEVVNSDFSEYVPVISSDESVLIFTYKGAKSKGTPPGVEGSKDADLYYEDVFMSKKKEGKWTSPIGIDSINTEENDAAVALSNDGQKLFVFKASTSDMGDLYICHLKGENWSKPQKLNGQVNTQYWEGSCSLSPDEKTLYFSSERPGGQGGRDLYSATLQPNGTWAGVKNLGPNINTPRDEDSPFSHPDGKTLYFSSIGHNSMGGYDIFKTEIQLDSTWSKPENAGFPINTIDDDIYYVLTSNGKKGYYSSGKQGGLGNQDIYIAELVPGQSPRLVMLHGTITLNEKPIEASIDVLRVNSTPFGTFNSNATEGKYLINLPAGNEYKVVYKVKGYEDKEYLVNTMTIDSFIEQNVGMDFYNKFTLTFVDSSGTKLGTAEQTGYRFFRFSNLPPDKPLMFKLEGEDSDKLTEIVIPINGMQVKIVRSGDRYFRYTPLNSDKTKLIAVSEEDTELNPNDPYESKVLKHGKETREGVVYTIQVAAYRHEKNYEYGKLESIGKVEKIKGNGRLTRFIMGEFSTLLESHQLFKKIKAAGCNDAFVVAIVNGKRVLLQDLDFLK